MESSYPMRIVAKKTGLSPHVIRIWERRYGAVQPLRTASNRRVYSEQDVKKLKVLNRLTQGGYSIGEIAQRSLKDLENLAGESSVTPANQNPLAKKMVQQCLDKIAQLDERGLEQVLNRGSLDLSQRHFLEQLIFPLVNEVGCLWEQGTFRVAHEHFATGFLRSYLGRLRASYMEKPNGPTIVVGTPAGQLHEIGALLAAKTAETEGWNVVYLGPNLPAEDLAATTINSGAVALGLSVVYPGGDSALSEEFSRLYQLIPSNIKIIYGGRSADSYKNLIHNNGGFLVKDLNEFRLKLRQLAKESPSSQDT